VIRRPATEAQILRTYLLLGDAHMAVDAPKEAVYFFAMAGQHAGPDRIGQVRSKMKQAVRRLDAAGISDLLDRLQDPMPVGYLLYQIGLNEIDAEDFSAATRSLETFLERFPE
jgi:hypothetical protein